MQLNHNVKSTTEWLTNVSTKVAYILHLVTFSAFIITTVFYAEGSQNSVVYANLVLLSIVCTFIHGSRSKFEYIFKIGLIAFSLIFMHVYLTPVLPYRGMRLDLYLSNIVASSNYWNPSFPTGKNATIRATIFNPMTSILTGLSMHETIYILQPIITFSLPVVVYLSVRNYSSKQTSFFAALSITYMFEYFGGMSLHSRQGTALLMIALFALIIAVPNSRSSNLLKITLLIGLIGSHYGTAYVFFGVLLVAYVVMFVMGLTDLFQVEDRKLLRYQFGSIFSVFLITWYSLAASGHLIDLLFGIVSSIPDQLSSLTEANTRATSKVVNTYSSSSKQFLKYSYIFLLATIGLGLVVELSSKILDKEHGYDSIPLEYLIITCGMISIFATKAFDVGFGIFRVFIITMMFSSVFAFRWNEMLSRVYEIDFSLLIRSALVIFLLMNTGFFAATVTDDIPRYSRLMQHETMDSENDAELFNMYLGYTSAEEKTCSTWLYENKPSNSQVYGSIAPGEFKPEFAMTSYQGVSSIKRPSLDYHPISDKNGKSGYIYVAPFSTKSDLFSVNHEGSFGNKEFMPVLNAVSHKRGVYESGSCSIYQ